MFYFLREATAALVPGFLCQSGHRRPENVSILSSLIRILALLQRKTLIETKNGALKCLKCLKWQYLTVRSMKNVAVLTEDGAFALFFHPHPGGFDSLRVPTHGNLPFMAKKILIPGSQPGGRAGCRWNWLMHYIFASYLLITFWSKLLNLYR